MDLIINIGGDDVFVWVLFVYLRYFYGIVVVGINGGIVYFIGNKLSI